MLDQKRFHKILILSGVFLLIFALFGIASARQSADLIAEGKQIFLWYGPDWEREAGAVLTLSPIVLDDMMSAG